MGSERPRNARLARPGWRRFMRRLYPPSEAAMQSDHVVFECPRCGQAITRPLAPLPADQRVCLEDGKPAIPPGYFALSNDDHWTGSGRCPLINLDDVVGTQYHPDVRRHSGCCGRDGCDGPNLNCTRGHEVGTERSDCWMPHAVVLLVNVKRRPV